MKNYHREEDREKSSDLVQNSCHDAGSDDFGTILVAQTRLLKILADHVVTDIRSKAPAIPCKKKAADTTIAT